MGNEARREFLAMDPGEDGWCEWVHPIPADHGLGYLMKCCDCELVHEMEFAIVPRDASNTGPLNEGESDAAVIIFRARRCEGDKRCPTSI